MKKKRFLPFMPLLLVSVLLIGCGGAADTPAVPSAVPEEPSAPSLPPTTPSIAPAPVAASEPESVPEPKPELQSPAPPAEVEEESTEASGPQKLSWEQAGRHIGESATVCGTVAGAKYANDISGQPTYLYIGKPYPAPDRFNVLIPGENRQKFSNAPERYYLGKTVCVRGRIMEDEGTAQIEINVPSQISEHEATD